MYSCLLFYVRFAAVYDLAVRTNETVKRNNAVRENVKTQLELQASQLELEQVYREMAYTDIMTELGNRTAYEERISHLEHDGCEVTIVSVDLNNLKVVNDENGHQAGDQFIKTAATMMREAFGDYGKIYRIGGDEFVIIMEGWQQLWVKSCISRLNKSIKEYNDPFMSMAVGYAKRMDHEKLWHLLKRADEQMYEDKIAYKNEISGEKSPFV